jgi:hypothetical protein
MGSLRISKGGLDLGLIRLQTASDFLLSSRQTCQQPDDAARFGQSLPSQGPGEVQLRARYSASLIILQDSHEIFVTGAVP